MKTYRLKVGEKYKYKIDFAGVTNSRENAEADWLDTSVSPAEQLATQSITLESPTGISVSGAALADSNTSVAFWVAGVTVGTWVLTCEVTTNTSPAQEKIVKLKYIVVNA